MLFYTARLSLCRLSVTSRRCTQSAPPETRHPISSNCEASIEAVTCIITRFRAQHTLRAAPLSFVHGAIAVADALLALGLTRPDLGRTYLPCCSSALREMGKTWRVAADAERGMRQVRSPMQQAMQPSSPDDGCPQRHQGEAQAVQRAECLAPVGGIGSMQCQPIWQSTDHIPADTLSLFDLGYDGGRSAEEMWLCHL